MQDVAEDVAQDVAQDVSAVLQSPLALDLAAQVLQVTESLRGSALTALLLRSQSSGLAESASESLRIISDTIGVWNNIERCVFFLRGCSRARGGCSVGNGCWGMGRHCPRVAGAKRWGIIGQPSPRAPTPSTDTSYAKT